MFTFFLRLTSIGAGRLASCLGGGGEAGGGSVAGGVWRCPERFPSLPYLTRVLQCMGGGRGLRDYAIPLYTLLRSRIICSLNTPTASSHSAPVHLSTTAGVLDAPGPCFGCCSCCSCGYCSCCCSCCFSCCCSTHSDIALILRSFYRCFACSSEFKLSDRVRHCCTDALRQRGYSFSASFFIK